MTSDEDMELVADVCDITMTATFTWPDGTSKQLELRALVASHGRLWGRAQDEPELLAAAATLALAAWEQEWRDEQPWQAVQFRCLGNRAGCWSDKKEVGYDWAISAARMLVQEGV